jgi:hypothetical protein
MRLTLNQPNPPKTFWTNFRRLFILLTLSASLGSATAANVSLHWNPSSGPGVVGYNIYYGTASDYYTKKITIGNTNTVAISNLVCGATYYFAVTAFDANGNESGFSNEATFIVPGIITLSSGPNPGGPLLIKFPVAPSHWYEVQTSTNLQSWATIWQTGVATSNAWVQYSDPNAGKFSSRFYRLVLH